ncbi:hypothetical protein NC653_014316 [Populus alba x Populus x berolinensis]|uniref:PORR domain-containing protein n=1 Tax=Populus alba x Populus x berolinensis TaxID=444605 RepID=A0AAD6QXN0_9ROSI|nr:hypothetical protein NC653_014316 [Populus alba x Populus x berolinensis]
MPGKGSGLINAMFVNNLNRCRHKHNSPSSSPSSIFYFLHRNFSLWSMKKDPDLESALSRNRRWIVNNQIKNIILRYPNQDAPVKFLQKKFKTLDLQELMQEGLHEYNRRRYEVNLEKQRKKGIVSVRKEKRKEGSTEMSEQDDSGDKLGALFDPEERKRLMQGIIEQDLKQLKECANPS